MKEEENEITLEDKMKRKFKKLKTIMTIIEGFLMVIPIMVIIIAVLVGIKIGMEGKENSSIIESAFDVEEGEEVDWKVEILDILNQKEDLQEDEDYQNASETLKTLMVVSNIIASFMGYIFAIIIVDCLAKIFGEVEKEGTPFTEKNIKLLKIVNIIAICLWLVGMMVSRNTVGLVFIIVISAFRSVFEYGYKLQKEADETL